MEDQRAFTLGGKEVVLSKVIVEKAVRNIEPGPIKKYSVVIRGIRYPIKQVVSAASGQPSAVFIATDAYRILMRLGFEVDGELLSQVKLNLTLHPIGWIGDGPVFGTGAVYQYRVGHMPPGYQALVANFGAPRRNDWKIMRIEDDAQEQWNGNYASAEDALAVLQKEFEVPIKETVLVQVEGGSSFSAEAELNLDKLDPANMPSKLTGVFTKLPSKTQGDTIHANFLLHSDRTGGGASHTIWFHGNRTGYRFRMMSEAALDFSADRI
jgi:hypothetical protein